MSILFSPSPALPTTPPSSSSRACRTFPLSPLNPFRYDQHQHQHGQHHDLKTEAGTSNTTEMNRDDPMSSPPISSTYRGDGGAFFPPPLGSSSPPIPSPTPGTSFSNPYYNHPPSSPCSVSTSTSTLRPNNSQSLSFASRARARQPLPPSHRAAPDPHARWGSQRPSLGRHSQSASAAGFTSFGESVDGMTERSVKGAMWRDKFRQQCLEVRDRDSKRVGGNGSGAVYGEGNGRSRQRSGASAGSTRRSKRDDKPKTFDPAADDDEDMSEDSEEQADNEEIFRLMMQKQRRQLMHQARVQYDREVGGSDPAVLEMDIRQAEAEAEAEAEAAAASSMSGTGTASNQFTSPLARPQPGQPSIPGTIWRYRPSPARNGIPMSTPLTEPTTDVFFMHTGGTNASASTSGMGDNTLENDYGRPQKGSEIDTGRQVELDEEELARLAQMEEEERLMIDRFGNGFRGPTHPPSDGFLDGLTWEDLEPDDDELGLGEDVEMSTG